MANKKLGTDAAALGKVEENSTFASRAKARKPAAKAVQSAENKAVRQGSTNSK